MVLCYSTTRCDTQPRPCDREVSILQTVCGFYSSFDARRWPAFSRPDFVGEPKANAPTHLEFQELVFCYCHAGASYAPSHCRSSNFLPASPRQDRVKAPHGNESSLVYTAYLFVELSEKLLLAVQRFPRACRDSFP